jgi:hypothetical protein
MSGFQGSISYNSKAGAPAGFINVAGARNGTSIDSGNFVVWGNLAGVAGNPAKLLNNREVPFNGNSVSFLDGLNTDPIISHIDFFTPNTVGAPMMNFVQVGNGTTDQSGNSGFFFSLQPSNFGVTYPSNFAPGSVITMQRWGIGYVLANSNDNSGIIGMPDAVLSFGYNTAANGSRISTGDASWRLGFETHFINDLEGPESNFEFHLPEITVFDGMAYRINSYYIDKTNAFGINLRTINQTTFFAQAENVLNQDTPYFEISRAFDGAQLTFFPASNTGRDVGIIRWQDLGGDSTIMGSFGSGDWAVQSSAAGSPGMIMNPDGSLLLQQTNPAGNSIGTTVIGNIQYGVDPKDSSAQLQVISTNKGFKEPIMSAAQVAAIASPGEGLQAYDLTNHAMRLFNGTSFDYVFSGNDAAAAPATVALVLPGSVFGSTASLLGAPAKWAAVNISGTIYKIPLYT